MNACTVCRHPRAASIDAELREPRANAARVARRYRLSEQAVRRHVRNRHVAPEPIEPVAPPSEPWLPPGMKRAATDAEFDAAVEAWLPAVASLSGLDEGLVRAHYESTVPHDEDCAECAAIDEHEPLFDAFIASVQK